MQRPASSSARSPGTSRRCATHVAPAAVMAVVKANGYGHGAVPAARAAIVGGAELARRRARGGGARAAPGRPRRADPVPDGRPRARPRRRHRGRGGPVGGIGRPGAPAGRRGGGRRTPGPGPSEGRHRAEPGRRRPGRLAGAARGRERGRGGGPGHRGRPLVALRLGRRAGQPLGRGPADGVQGGPRGRREHGHHRAGCGTSPTPRPRSTCRRRATTWCASAAGATAWPRCRAARLPGCGRR